MMSNSNYSIGLQRLKSVHIPFKLTRFINVSCTIWPKIVTRRKWPKLRRDRDIDNFSQDETDTRCWYISRPSWDQDVETETTTLLITHHKATWHNYTIGTLHVLKAYDACADMGQILCSVPVFPVSVTCDW